MTSLFFYSLKGKLTLIDRLRVESGSLAGRLPSAHIAAVGVSDKQVEPVAGWDNIAEVAVETTVGLGHTFPAEPVDNYHRGSSPDNHMILAAEQNHTLRPVVHQEHN